MRFLTATFSKNFIFSVLSKREPPPLCFASMHSLLYPLVRSSENQNLKIFIGHMNNPSTSFPVQHDYLQKIFSDIEKSPHLFPHNSAKLHPSFWNLFSFSVLPKREPPPLCFGTIPSTSLAVGGMCWEPKFENFHRSYEEPFYFFSRQEGGVYQKNLRIWKKSSFWIKTWRCFWKNESVTLQVATSSLIPSKEDFGVFRKNFSFFFRNSEACLN